MVKHIDIDIRVKVRVADRSAVRRESSKSVERGCAESIGFEKKGRYSSDENDRTSDTIEFYE